MKRIKITPICSKGRIIKSKEYKDYIIIGKYWIDFEGDNVASVRIIDNGAYYIVEQYLKEDSKSITTKSIGLINEIRKDFIINVQARVFVEPPMSLTNFDLESQTNTIILFILVILWLGLQFMAYTFKNFGFASFGFFTGIIIGLLLFQLSILLTLVFILINVVLYIGFTKGKR